MKLAYVITFLAAAGFTAVGSCFYRLIPEYEAEKKEEKKIESEEAGEVEEEKGEVPEKTSAADAGQVKKYSIISIVLSVIASLFYIFLYKQNDAMQTVKTLTLLAVLFPVAYFDYIFYKIPNKILKYAVIVRAAELIPEALIYRKEMAGVLIDMGITLAVLFLICMVCNLIIRGAMGMGDVKLLLVMGLYLGSAKFILAILVVLILAFFAAIYFVASGKKTKKDIMPFAPYILAGTYLAVILLGI